MDAFNIINDFIREESREKIMIENEIINRKTKVKQLIENHKRVRNDNEEIMKDVKMIKHPDTYEEYKKQSFRRWVGNQGKYRV